VKNEDLKELLTSLSGTPAGVARLVRDLRFESIVVRPSRDEFSILENVCHLRDIEIEGYAVRIRRILTEDEPVLADVDGTKLAIEREYNRQDLKQSLTEFTSARNQNFAILNEVAASAFDRSGTMEGVGTISLERLLEMMLDHDQSHLEDIERTLHRLPKISR